jgi:hypothetical protein
MCRSCYNHWYKKSVNSPYNSEEAKKKRAEKRTQKELKKKADAHKAAERLKDVRTRKNEEKDKSAKWCHTTGCGNPARWANRCDTCFAAIRYGFGVEPAKVRKETIDRDKLWSAAYPVMVEDCKKHPDAPYIHWIRRPLIEMKASEDVRREIGSPEELFYCQASTHDSYHWWKGDPDFDPPGLVWSARLGKLVRESAESPAEGDWS